MGDCFSCFKDCSVGEEYESEQLLSDKYSFPYGGESHEIVTFSVATVEMIKYDFEHDTCRTYEVQAYLFNGTLIETSTSALHIISTSEGHRGCCVPANAKYLNDNFWFVLIDINAILDGSSTTHNLYITDMYSVISSLRILDTLYLSRPTDFHQNLTIFKKSFGMDGIHFAYKNNHIQPIKCKQINGTSIIRNKMNDEVCYKDIRVMVGHETWFTADGIYLFRESQIIPCQRNVITYSFTAYLIIAFCIITIILCLFQKSNKKRAEEGFQYKDHEDVDFKKKNCGIYVVNV
uniref:CUB domain-containing protein n=1 Tax=Rhabditophanes sp. KR3021 TaxID=114890 RepID=A0AC35TZE7_9BILA